jgi:hypothetical protein
MCWSALRLVELRNAGKQRGRSFRPSQLLQLLINPTAMLSSKHDADAPPRACDTDIEDAGRQSCQHGREECQAGGIQVSERPVWSRASADDFNPKVRREER